MASDSQDMASTAAHAPADQPDIPPNTLGISLRTVWTYVGLALIALIALNVLLYVIFFVAPYVNLNGLHLPYSENFDDKTSADFVPLRGVWEVLDGFLIQHNPSGSDLSMVIPLAIYEDQPYQYQADMKRIDGQMGGGLLFNMQKRNRHQQAQVARFNVADNGELAVIYGFFGSDGIFVGQGGTDPLGIPGDTADNHTLAVQVGTETYNVLMDGQTVARDIPLQYRGGRIGLITVQSKVVFDNLQANPMVETLPQPTAVPATAPAVEAPAATLPPAAPVEVGPFPGQGERVFNDIFGDGTLRDRWIPFAGDWAFEPGAYVQGNANGYDFGAGYTEPFGPSVLRVQFQHRQGAGGGVLFNMPQPDRRNGAHLVRYMDDQSVAWGYFDESGAFVGQGGTGVPAPGTAAHILEVLNNGSTYSVRLDGAQIATDIPIVSTGSHIGLTNSQSVVAFQNVEVYGLTGAAPAPSNLGDIDIISGDWVRENGITTQRNDAATDFLAGTGVIGETYRVSVEITLPADEALADAGGGLVIHMEGREDPRLGYMVRFGDGGKLIMWGSYDEQGVFNGQGGSPLELEAGTAHNLTLQVRQGAFNIVVDDNTIATDIPLQRDSGWIGLVSFRGPVSFSNFQLALGGG